MKKIVYSSILCIALVVSYSVVVGLEEDELALTNSSENLFEGKNSLDPIDSERSSDLHDPEVVDDQDWLKDDSASGDTVQQPDDVGVNDEMHDEKIETEEIAPQQELTQSEQKPDDVNAAELPKLTTKDLYGAVEMHEKIAEKYKELANNIQKIWAALQGSELGKEVNIVDLTQLLHNAEHAHKNAGSLFELMLTIQKLGFELGDKLESELHMKARDLSIKAQELTEKATEEMIKSLGLKPVLKI